MSSSTIAKAATLKPEIRLAQSVSEFEASLCDEHKATFRSYRAQSLDKPLASSDVMRLTAEVDRCAVQQKGGGQCFGPRLTNILQAVQQYAALGDVIIGGSQNIIACGIWSLLRLTLLALVSFSSYMDKLSKLLMVAGRKAPRYEQMALLYPRSSDLQSNLSEYFIVVVQLCHKLYAATQKSTLGSYFSFLSDLDLKEHETSLQLWGDCIKDEVTLLTARKIAEQSTFMGALSKNAQHESHRRQIETRLGILEACSIYDYQTTWKEIRKSGNSTILAQLDQYTTWKTETTSSTLLFTGKLGFGKSVLLANMIDELNLSTKSEGPAVIYFFCRHDIQESLRARTIIGSIARQLISTNMTQLLDEIPHTSRTLGLDDLLDIVLTIIPKSTAAFLVLDGLDECDDCEKENTLRCLRRLQEGFSLKVCCSFRSDIHLKGTTEAMELLSHSNVVHLPEDNPDISTFVTAELERCIESGRLCVRDSTLISQIQRVLVHRAQGMFLWVVLQITSLCAAQSDEEVREALEDLPKGLPETFSRILQKSRGTGEKYQKRILQLCMVARRPLTTEELREALSVRLYNTEWNPARLINNIYSVLPFCGSLITIEEENLTVRFLHHSVKQYLLGDFDLAGRPVLTLDDANQTMGEVVVTYLNYSMFENALSTTVFTEIMAQDIPSNIVRSALRHSTPVRQVALRMLKHKRSFQHDLRDTLLRARDATSQNVHVEFHAYAQAYWLWHIQWVFLYQDTRALDLLMTVLKKGRVNVHNKDDNGETLLFRAVESASPGVVKHLLDYDFGIHDANMKGSTTLHVAADRGETSIISYLLDRGANIEEVDYDGVTPLLLAASRGHQAAVAHLVEFGANVEAQNKDGMTALSLAACQENPGTLIYLLKVGANSSHENKDRCRPLSLAATKGHQQVVRILMEHGYYHGLEGHANSGVLVHDSDADLEARDKEGRTAAFKAAYQGHFTVLGHLLDAGANIDATDNNHRTVLALLASEGRTLVVESLLARGASVNAVGNDGWTALHWAAYKGHNTVTLRLLDWHADIEAKGKNSWTPLLLAISRGHETVVQSLIDRGARIEAEHRDGRSAMQIATDEGYETIRQLLDDYTGLSLGHLVVRGRALFRAVSIGEQALLGMSSLIKNRADTEVRDEHGATPLLRAVASGHISMVKLLHANGANISAKTADGKTALHLAAEHGHLVIMQYILKWRVDGNASSSDGKTALHISATRGDRDAAQLLLENHARVGSSTPDGRTALHLSAELGHQDLVQLLLNHGAEKDCKTLDGRTALHLSAEGGHVQVVKCLLDNGADMEIENGDGRTALALGSAAVVEYLRWRRVVLDFAASVS